MKNRKTIGDLTVIEILNAVNPHYKKTIEEFLTNFRDSQKHYQEIINRVSDSINEIANDFSSFLAKSNTPLKEFDGFPGFVDKFCDLFNQIAKYGNFEKHFFELGWIIPPYFRKNINDNRFMFTTMYQVDTLNKLDRHIIKLLSINDFFYLRKMVIRWNSNLLFRKRKKLFNDSIEIFISNKNNKNQNIYNFIIPTLIANLDGLIIDVLEFKEIKFYNKKTIENSKIIKRKNARKIYIDSLLRNFFTELLLDKILFGNTLTKEIFKIELIPELIENRLNLNQANNFNNLNRHKILHGEDLDYGNLKNMLNILFLFDCIFEILESEKKEENKLT